MRTVWSVSKSFFISILSLFLFLTSAAGAVFADSATGGLTNPTKFTSLGDVIGNALPLVFVLVALFATVVFVIGGLRYLSSMGDPKAAEGARNTMTGAVIGLIIVLGAAATSSVFETVFGISLFGTTQRPPFNLGNNYFDLNCAFKLSDGTCIGVRFLSFGQLVSWILLLLLSVGGVVFFLILLWGGIRYMLSRGDEKAVASARSTLANAGIGLLLMIGGLVIIRLIVSQLFKVSF